MEALRSPPTQGAQAAGGELLAAVPNAFEVQNRAGSCQELRDVLRHDSQTRPHVGNTPGALHTSGAGPSQAF